jgi:mRNA interferase MazF
VRLDPTLGSEIKKIRPCLVVGTNVLNERRRTVVVVPLSSAPQAAPPLLVPVVSGNRKAVAVVDQIRAVTKERFTRRMSVLSPEDLATVEESLRIILEL